MCRHPEAAQGTRQIRHDRADEEAGRTMSDTGWPDRLCGAFRVELRAEALGLAGRGWPVIPGTCVAGQQETDSAEGWTRPVPIQNDWHERASANPQEVAETWASYPYSLLVSTGTVLDAVEVDDVLGKRAARLLRVIGLPAPIVALPDGRWLFLTRTARQLPAELAENSDVQWHTVGSWVSLPPTPFSQGVVHWRVKPTAWGWRLPAPEVVQDVLVGALCNELPSTVQRSVAASSAA